MQGAPTPLIAGPQTRLVITASLQPEDTIRRYNTPPQHNTTPLQHTALHQNTSTNTPLPTTLSGETHPKNSEPSDDFSLLRRFLSCTMLKSASLLKSVLAWPESLLDLRLSRRRSSSRRTVSWRPLWGGGVRAGLSMRLGQGIKQRII